jgi:hypothetical protein
VLKFVFGFSNHFPSSKSIIRFKCGSGFIFSWIRLMIVMQALFIRLIIRLFQLVFSAGTVFFSHNKSVNSVFQPTYQYSRTGPQAYKWTNLRGTAHCFPLQGFVFFVCMCDLCIVCVRRQRGRGCCIRRIGWAFVTWRQLYTLAHT